MLIKVCGLTRYEDVEFCDNFGIDFVGFIFYKKSPRCIDTNFVKNIRCKNSLKVGVFVDHAVDDILDIYNEAKLDLVQLHGDYSIKDVEKIGKNRSIKVLWPDSCQNKIDFFNQVKIYVDICKYILIDSGKSGGGHGKSIKNIEWLKELSNDINWFLAGGITYDNIDNMLKNVKPIGLDINSGVEVRAGIKDLKKIELFYNKIKELS